MYKRASEEKQESIKMLEVTNIKVYDLKESVIASGNAMRLHPVEYTDEEFGKGLARMKRLIAASRNGEIKCHHSAIKGIRVSFDVKYPQYWTPEAQRYKWFDIVTSSSKMHRLMSMNIDEACNKYVSQTKVEETQRDCELYNIIARDNISHWMFVLRDGKSIVCHSNEECLYVARMIALSGCPLGLELFERVSTNYLQLQTIYHQRKHHRLKEWHNFCLFIERLPYFQELILGQDYDPNYDYISDIDV